MTSKPLFSISTEPPECRLDSAQVALASPSIELFDSVAQRIATEVAEPLILEKRWNPKTKKEEWRIKRLNNANKSAQLRKFYDELCMWEEKSRDLASLTKTLPFIKMLNAKAAYAKGREHVDDKFVAFMNGCLRQIQAADENGLQVLKNFKTLFEAFLGFYRALER